MTTATTAGQRQAERPVGASPPLRLAAFGTGGSVSETLGHVMRGLREVAVPAEVTLIDLQAFHLRAPGRMTPPEGAAVVRVTPRDVGYATPLRSMTLNLALSGGRLAHRRMIRRARATLAAIAPDVLLCCHDRFYIETAFLSAARDLAIPTVLLQEGPFCVIGHGAANAPGLRLKNALAPAARRIGLTPGMPDYGMAGHTRILAASARYRDAWIARGVPGARISVTGVPRYDGLAEAHAGRSAAHRGARARTPVVMVLIQPFGAHGKVDPAAARTALAVVGDALDLLARECAVDIRIRQHPRSGSQEAEPLTAQLGAPFTIEEASTPFPERAADLDLVVGFYSSAMLEALALGVPCVGMRLPEVSFTEPGEAAKQARLAEIGVPFADDPGALRANVATLLAQPARAPDAGAAEAETGPLDGNAARRAATAIAALAGRRVEGHAAQSATGRAA